MRPEGCLVDCVGWINWADPEEDHDAVDACEADKCAEGEDAI